MSCFSLPQNHDSIPRLDGRPVDDRRLLQISEAQRLIESQPADSFDRQALVDAWNRPTTVWRFPWPDEDILEHAADLPRLLAGRPKSRSISIALPDEAAIWVAGLRHHHILLPLKISGRTASTLQTACPAGQSPAPKRAAKRAPITVNLVGAQRADDRIQPIWQCRACGIWFRTPAEITEILARALRPRHCSPWLEDWVEKVSSRLTAVDR